MPVHQSKNDRINEDSVLEGTRMWLKERGIEVVRSAPETTSSTDCIWHDRDGLPVLVQEVKCRFKVRKQDYRSYKVDKAKIDEGIQLAKKLGVEFLHTVWWGEETIGDDVAWARFINEEEAKEFEVDPNWGRSAERDDYDHDAAYCIPTISFNLDIPMYRNRLHSKNGR